jgi:hypothetical protein
MRWWSRRPSSTVFMKTSRRWRRKIWHLMPLGMGMIMIHEAAELSEVDEGMAGEGGTDSELDLFN